MTTTGSWSAAGRLSMDTATIFPFASTFVDGFRCQHDT
jgi:hypothetical protein